MTAAFLRHWPKKIRTRLVSNFRAVGSIPTAPTNHLPDWSDLDKTRRGKRGQIIPMIRFVRDFSAARVTTGFVGT
jgi:hypothetical protein